MGRFSARRPWPHPWWAPVVLGHLAPAGRARGCEHGREGGCEAEGGREVLAQPQTGLGSPAATIAVEGNRLSPARGPGPRWLWPLGGSIGWQGSNT